MSLTITSDRLPSDSSLGNKVFSDNSEANTEFQKVKNNLKRPYFSISSMKKKKLKLVFVSTNRFNIFNPNDNENVTEIYDAFKKNNLVDNSEQINSLRPPIFVRNVGNFIELRNK